MQSIYSIFNKVKVTFNTLLKIILQANFIFILFHSFHPSSHVIYFALLSYLFHWLFPSLKMQQLFIDRRI